MTTLGMSVSMMRILINLDSLMRGMIFSSSFLKEVLDWPLSVFCSGSRRVGYLAPILRTVTAPSKVVPR